MFECVCANTVTSPFFILFFVVDLALIVENLDVITESRLLGRVLLQNVGWWLKFI